MGLIGRFIFGCNIVRCFFWFAFLLRPAFLRNKR